MCTKLYFPKEDCLYLSFIIFLIEFSIINFPGENFLPLQNTSYLILYIHYPVSFLLYSMHRINSIMKLKFKDYIDKNKTIYFAIVFVFDVVIFKTMIKKFRNLYNRENIFSFFYFCVYKLKAKLCIIFNRRVVYIFKQLFQ